MKRARGKLSNAPKLANLPPTTEAFNENVYRARTKGLIWNSCLDQSPPNSLMILFPAVLKTNIRFIFSVDGLKTKKTELSQRSVCPIT